MAQDFAPIQPTDTISASLPILNADLICLLSNFAGTSFPVTNLYIGMTCYRTDQHKTYRLNSLAPSVWILIDRTDQTYLSQELGDGRYFQRDTLVRSSLYIQGQGAAGADQNGIYFANNLNVTKWGLIKNSAQNLAVYRYDDNGNLIDAPFVIDTANGNLLHRDKLIWDSGNDGINSGLDADLVRSKTPGAGGLAVLEATSSAGVLTALGITNGVAQTGQIAPFWASYADIVPGYVALCGGSIGKTGSTATVRANDDTQSLYTWLWLRAAPVVGGRGASAAADWAAGKPLVLGDTRGRTLVGLDYHPITGQASVNLLGNYNSVGDVAGAYRHTLGYYEMPSHGHTAIVYDPTHTHGSNANYAGGGMSGGGGNQQGTPPAGATIFGAYTGISVGIAGAGGDQPHNNMQPYLLISWHIKL